MGQASFAAGSHHNLEDSEHGRCSWQPALAARIEQKNDVYMRRARCTGAWSPTRRLASQQRRESRRAQTNPLTHLPPLLYAVQLEVYKSNTMGGERVRCAPSSTPYLCCRLLAALSDCSSAPEGGAAAPKTSPARPPGSPPPAPAAGCT
jgi:hypothetical protein